MSVADEPTRQYTLHGFALPVTTELPFMVSVLATLKMKIPDPLSVRVVEAAKFGRAQRIDAWADAATDSSGAGSGNVAPALAC